MTVDESSTVESTEKGQAAALARINRLSRLMDSSIPLPGGYRIGWDGVIGLVPGIGDVAGMLISLYIVAGARRSGASGATLIRMLLNVGIEALIGAVPIIGDLFDLMFKANNRNMQILNRQLEKPTVVARQSRQRMWLIGIAVASIFILAAYVIVRVLVALIQWLF